MLWLVELIEDKEITGYFLEDIKKHLGVKEWLYFEHWIRGQTVAVINGKELVYEWDYERWENGKTKLRI